MSEILWRVLLEPRNPTGAMLSLYTRSSAFIILKVCFRFVQSRALLSIHLSHTFVQVVCNM